jgi:hypothetical protein
MSRVEEWVRVLDHRNYTTVKVDFGNGVCLGRMQFIEQWIFIRLEIMHPRRGFS